MNASSSTSSVPTSVSCHRSVDGGCPEPRDLQAEPRLFAVSNSKLWRRARLGAMAGNDWQAAGGAFEVGAMTVHQGGLYLASRLTLWKRGRVGPKTGNDWSEVGTLPGDPVAMASHEGALFAAFENRLWRRGVTFGGTTERWLAIGDAYGVTAMTSHEGRLLAVSDGLLWARTNVGSETGSDWLDVGALTASYPPPDVFAMASHGGSLYAVFNDTLNRRVEAEPRMAGGPWTAPVWEVLGDAFSVTGMAFYTTTWG